MITKYKEAILGWEIHAFDENGEIYVKERFASQFGIVCNGFYVIRDDESATIYEGIKPKRKNNAISQLVFEPLKKHSQKPKIIKDRIVELMGDLPRIELFAREKTDGWDVWGDEVESSIEL